jgi:GMP synthase (glutamine-hydrolysing)
MHGDTFDIPSSAIHLATSQECSSQAFKYGNNAYGLQFHLEADSAMITRFLKDPQSRSDAIAFAGQERLDKIELETKHYLPRSLKLSHGVFNRFIDLFGKEINASKINAHGKGK